MLFPDPTPPRNTLSCSFCLDFMYVLYQNTCLSLDAKYNLNSKSLRYLSNVRVANKSKGYHLQKHGLLKDLLKLRAEAQI